MDVVDLRVIDGKVQDTVPSGSRVEKDSIERMEEVCVRVPTATMSRRWLTPALKQRET